jgi:hypothetical protein
MVSWVEKQSNTGHHKLSPKGSMQVATFLGLLWSANGVLASQNQSSKPGGVFQLKPGTYVERTSSCADPANAAIIFYDGKSLASSSTHACEARIIGRRGKSISVSQSCIDAGVGAAPRVVEHFEISINNAIEFSINKHAGAEVYRFCPPSQLPKSLRRSLVTGTGG